MQSPWLVAALTIATFGIYGIYWLGLTWWQFQQEDGDRHMHPFWHAVASLVPIYGYFRFHAHMRLLAEFGRGAPWTLAPGPVTLAWIVLNVVGFAAARPEVPNWLPLVVTLADGALFGYAQDALNAAWRSRSAGGVPAQMHPLHWALLIVGGLLWVAVLAS